MKDIWIVDKIADNLQEVNNNSFSEGHQPLGLTAGGYLSHAKETQEWISLRTI